jgi:riboflavin kinase/FMN adenylyltransferase
MTVAYDFAGWPQGPLHVGIGAFDGVHLGHQALIGELARGATAGHATPVVTTFDPLPIEFLAPGAPPARLSEIDERVRLLTAAGAGAVVVFRFTKEFSSLSADEFAARVAGAGALRRVLVGADFKYGHDRGGNAATLRAFGGRQGFSVDIAPAFTQGGAIVSSTRVRNALLAGAIDEATSLLGRPYTVTGVVEEGPARGRALGYPTVSIDVPRRRLLPRDGIYAAWASLGERRVMAASSVGVQPKVGGSDRRLEVFLLDAHDEHPGEPVTIEFVRRLRDELRFESPDALSQQIAKDVDETRRVLSERPLL